MPEGLFEGRGPYSPPSKTSTKTADDKDMTEKAQAQAQESKTNEETVRPVLDSNQTVAEAINRKEMLEAKAQSYLQNTAELRKISRLYDLLLANSRNQASFKSFVRQNASEALAFALSIPYFDKKQEQQSFLKLLDDETIAEAMAYHPLRAKDKVATQNVKPIPEAALDLMMEDQMYFIDGFFGEVEKILNVVSTPAALEEPQTDTEQKAADILKDYARVAQSKENLPYFIYEDLRQKENILAHDLAAIILSYRALHDAIKAQDSNAIISYIKGLENRLDKKIILNLIEAEETKDIFSLILNPKASYNAQARTMLFHAIIENGFYNQTQSPLSIADIENLYMKDLCNYSVPALAIKLAEAGIFKKTDSLTLAKQYLDQADRTQNTHSIAHEIAARHIKYAYPALSVEAIENAFEFYDVLNAKLKPESAKKIIDQSAITPEFLYVLKMIIADQSVCPFKNFPVTDVESAKVFSYIVDAAYQNGLAPTIDPKALYQKLPLKHGIYTDDANRALKASIIEYIAAYDKAAYKELALNILSDLDKSTIHVFILNTILEPFNAHEKLDILYTLADQKKDVADYLGVFKEGLLRSDEAMLVQPRQIANLWFEKRSVISCKTPHVQIELTDRIQHEDAERLIRAFLSHDNFDVVIVDDSEIIRPDDVQFISRQDTADQARLLISFGHQTCLITFGKHSRDSFESVVDTLKEKIPLLDISGDIFCNIGKIICVDLTQNSIVTSSGLIKINPEKNNDEDVSSSHAGLLKTLQKDKGFAIANNKALNLNKAIFYTTNNHGEITTYWAGDVHFGLQTEKSVLQTDTVFKTEQKNHYYLDLSQIDAVELDPKTNEVLKLVSNGVESIIPTAKLRAAITADLKASSHLFVAINDSLSVNASRLVRIDDENRNKKTVGTTEELHFIFEKGLTSTSFSTSYAAQTDMIERLAAVNPKIVRLNTSDKNALEVVNLDNITAISHSLTNKDGTGVLDVVDFISKRKVAVVSPQAELAKLHEASLNPETDFYRRDLFITQFFAPYTTTRVRPKSYDAKDVDTETRQANHDFVALSQLKIARPLKHELDDIPPKVITLDTMVTPPKSVFTRAQEMAVLALESTDTVAILDQPKQHTKSKVAPT